MTRGQLVAELLGTWEEAASQLAQSGHHRAASSVRTAIRVLEKTYSGDELGVIGAWGTSSDDYCEESD